MLPEGGRVSLRVVIVYLCQFAQPTATLFTTGGAALPLLFFFGISAICTALEGWVCYTEAGLFECRELYTSRTCK